MQPGPASGSSECDCDVPIFAMRVRIRNIIPKIYWWRIAKLILRTASGKSFMTFIRNVSPPLCSDSRLTRGSTPYGSSVRARFPTSRRAPHRKRGNPSESGGLDGFPDLPRVFPKAGCQFGAVAKPHETILIITSKAVKQMPCAFNRSL